MVWMDRLGLKGRAITSCVLLLLGAVSLTSTALIWQQNQSLLREITESVVIHARVMSYTAEPYVLLNDRKALEKVAHAAASADETQVAEVLDARGQVLAGFYREGNYSPQGGATIEGLLGTRADRDTSHVEQTATQLLVMVPIWPDTSNLSRIDVGIVGQEGVDAPSPDRPIGWVRLIYGLEDARKELASNVVSSIAISIVVIVVGIGVTILMIRQMITPVRDLVATATAIAGGDLTKRASEQAVGEIGVLARAFNSMADALGIYTQHLEDQVLERTAALVESEARTRAIVDTAADGIITIDEQGTIASFNAAAESIFGHSAEEIVGRHVGALMPSSPAEVHGRSAQDGLRTWEQRLIGAGRELEGRRIDGTTFPMDLSVSELCLSKRHMFTIIVRDVTERKKAAEKLETLHQELLDTSRRAGMAEVASGVLHNVGNVLNSVNVSVTMVTDKMRESRISSVAKAAALMREHAADLGTFITADERGRQLPGYLAKLAEYLTNEQDTILGELQSLRDNVEHIKSIVAMQQSYAKMGGVIESFSVSEMVENSLRLSSSSFERQGIQVVREYEEVPPVRGDRQKILQILTNLVQNAKQALRDSNRPDKRLTVRVACSGRNGVRVEVTDTGVGIPPENMSRIFSHGFTTKKDGHGFGLHNSALSAKELGGALMAFSDGPGKGARFVLDIPLQPAVAGTRTRTKKTEPHSTPPRHPQE